MTREEKEQFVMDHENLADATDLIDILGGELLEREDDERVDALYNILIAFDGVK